MELLEFLGDFQKREILAGLLLSVREKAVQADLFGVDGDGENLNSTLDEIFSVVSNREPLYRRWSQEADKNRNFSVPKKPLGRFIEGYLLPLVKTAEPYEGCHGGELGWGVRKSLATHIPCRSAFSFDLKNAFESFPEQKVYDFYFGLVGGIQTEERELVTRFLTEVSTVPYQGNHELPVGSSLSMALFNRALNPLDQRLTRAAEQRGFRYSRWVDDITLSSPYEMRAESFFGAVELTESHHLVSKHKVYFQSNGDIYLLGYKITSEGRVLKNTNEERLRDKTPPLNFEEWFGENRIRNYESWRKNEN
ncbi:MAG: reverse transcriptase domain-containing protein [Patescibacteria group bacterium]|nr:reverse transcriptase domain-containing protein [Patescibacteria group bacterium]